MESIKVGCNPNLGIALFSIKAVSLALSQRYRIVDAGVRCKRTFKAIPCIKGTLVQSQPVYFPQVSRMSRHKIIWLVAIVISNTMLFSWFPWWFQFVCYQFVANNILKRFGEAAVSHLSKLAIMEWLTISKKINWIHLFWLLRDDSELYYQGVSTLKVN